MSLNLLRYFNGTATPAFLKTPFASSETVFSNNLVIYLKDLKLSLLTISALKSAVHLLNKTINYHVKHWHNKI